MGHHTYEESIRLVYRGLILLAVVTMVEVAISLMAKGHVPGFHWMKGSAWIATAAALTIAALSIYKAYFIIYEFMHMRYENKMLARTVLLPTLLLVWAIVAFIWEGSAWKGNRAKINARNKMGYEQVVQPVQHSETDKETKKQEDTHKTQQTEQHNSGH